MAARGKLIVLEGIDGSGKRTQLDLLGSAFKSRGIPFTQVGFPNYDGFFGKMVAQFLNGEFGPLDAVDPHFSALLYAGDRLEWKSMIESSIEGGEWVLADRYIGSNLAHQGGRMLPDDRDKFLEWLKRLEYEIYGLPKEDLVVYLRVPVDEAQRLVGQKAARAYTDKRHDLQEADVEHLQAAADVYDELARQTNWSLIECWDAATGAMRSPETIHSDIVTKVDAVLRG